MTIIIIKSRKMKWAGLVPRARLKRCANTIFIEKPKRKRPLGTPKRRCKYNIEIDLKEIE
jgi:hypothetical protein